MWWGSISIRRIVVLCCDEKSRCQALERTQPGLPLRQGHIRTETHDFYRHGTVTLLAALDYLSDKVFAHTAARHTHRQWLDFLRKINREVPSELEIHVICDNYATHKHRKVTSWLKRHRRFHLHFTPTSSSWLNLVERFFGELTRKVVRPGSFRSVGELVADILRFLDQRNQNPTPYRWTADPEKVLAKIDQAWEALLEEVYNPIYGTPHYVSRGGAEGSRPGTLPAPRGRRSSLRFHGEARDDAVLTNRARFPLWRRSGKGGSLLRK